MRHLIFAAAALFATPLAAAAQDRLDEPMCIHNDTVKAIQAGAPVPAAAEITAACRARYNWDEASTSKAQLIAITMFLYLEYERDAVASGIDPRVVDAVFATLTPEQVAQYGTPERPMADNAPVLRVANKRLKAHGLSGTALDKAQVLMSIRGLTANLVTEFFAVRAAAK